MSYDIAGEPHLVAAYTCTPLVKFKLKDLVPGNKVRGTTIAELGNYNAPLDMVPYTKDGKSYLLIANTNRGVMKVDTETIGDIKKIEERVARGKTAGLPYETIEALQGTSQLCAWSNTHAIALIRRENGQQDLVTIELP